MTGTYGWATTEPVDVTAIGPTAVLIARVNGAGAFTLEAREDGLVYVNGRASSLYDEEWLDLADLVLMGSAADPSGRSVRVAIGDGESFLTYRAIS
jgi:hypothetical protein